MSACLCVSNNYKCIHNPTLYTIKRKICKFNVCSIFSLCVIMCLIVIYTGIVSRVVYKCGNVRDYTDWVVVFVLTVFINY